MPVSQVPAHILVVDDDALIRATLRDCLEIDGYSVSEASTGKELFAHLAATPTDLITLDLGLGRESGLDIARQVRARADVPIIMVTGKGDTIDRIVGLELGADEYITKPFHVREVLARVRAVLRRNAGAKTQAPADRLSFAGWTLDTGRRELTDASDRAHDLTTAEYDLLLLFLERPQRALSRDTIMDLLKGHDWTPFDRSIDSLIVRLRKKLEPSESPLIKTVRGVGYVFAAEVRKG